MLYFAGNTTQAQVTSQLGRSSFGVFGSLNFQNINGKDANGNTLQNSLVLRFNAGINYEIPIAPEFYFQPGIQFITKGTKGEVIFTQNNIAHLVKREIKMSYVEVPLNLVFKPMLGSGYVVLGLMWAMPLAGKPYFQAHPHPQMPTCSLLKQHPQMMTITFSILKEPIWVQISLPDMNLAMD
ncbi:MAG: PorT family protein [Bacteroidia bacterium]|nr:PorT family protein [Bacteroidia bacterium]